MVSRDVVFDELAMVHDLPRGDSDKNEEQNHSTRVELKIGQEEQLEVAEQSSSELIDSNTLPTLSTPPATPQYSIAKDRLRIQIRSPQKYEEAYLVAYTLNVAEEIDSIEEPAIYTESVSYSDSSIQLIAIHKEMKSLNIICTQDLMKLSKDRSVVLLQASVQKER